MRGEVIAFLLAAVDEPPSALAAAWYLLGRNPAAEHRFHAELDAALGGREPALEEGRHLPYLAAVVRETLRLLPPARHVDRCPVSHVRLADAHVRPGANVLVSPAVLHREPLLRSARRVRAGAMARARPSSGARRIPPVRRRRTRLYRRAARARDRHALAGRDRPPLAAPRRPGDAAAGQPRRPARRHAGAPMTARADNGDLLGLLDGLLYGDAFDCAVTLDELWRFARVPIAQDELRRLLTGDPELARLVHERDGFYSLRGRSHLAGRRPARIERSILRRRARRVARVVRHAPFVRGLVLTGSAAADDAGPEADLDLLVICARGRIGTVFLLLASLSRLVGRRLLCPNYYLAADNLAVTRRDVYVGHEIARRRPARRSERRRCSRPTPGSASSSPTCVRRHGRAAPSDPVLQRALEAPLRGRAGKRLERLAGRVARSRLAAHYRARGERPPADVLDRLARGSSLSFHGLPLAEQALARYTSRVAELRAELGRIGSGTRR